MKKLVAISLVFFSAIAIAKREHGAHVHGAGKLSIAFDGDKGKVEFETPALSIVGFEHLAKSVKDQKTVSEAKLQFEKQIQQIVQMSPSLHCQFQKEKVDVKADEDGDHSDFIASFNVSCAKSPAGETVTIDFSKYPHLKDVDVTILVGDLQKTAQLKSQPQTIELKP